MLAFPTPERVAYGIVETCAPRVMARDHHHLAVRDIGLRTLLPRHDSLLSGPPSPFVVGESQERSSTTTPATMVTMPSQR